MHYYPALKSQQRQIQFLLHCTSARPALNFTRRDDFTQVFWDKTRKDFFFNPLLWGVARSTVDQKQRESVDSSCTPLHLDSHDVPIEWIL